jgi:hypothetical protein
MNGPVQEFLADSALQAAEDLAAAYRRIPADRRNWAPAGENGAQARSARSQVIECALINAHTVGLLATHQAPADMMEAYGRDSAAAEALDDDALLALLAENTKKVADATRTIPTDALNVAVPMPWGPMTVTRLAANAYWNMTYHLGQVNYIAQLLGCLE